MLWQRSLPQKSQPFLPDQSERVELARRLHDGLAQELIALGYSLDEIIGRSALDNKIRSELRALRLRVIEISETFRDEIYLLRLLSFEQLKARISELFHDRELELALPEISISQGIEDGICRAVLEMARNSARHSQGEKFSVTHTLSERRIEIEVWDNGSGEISLKERSFGMASIQEHLERAGAEFSLDSGTDGNLYKIRLNL